MDNLHTIYKKRVVSRDPDLSYCSKCGGLLIPQWENNGFSRDEGESMLEITGYKCQMCGNKE